MMTPERVDRMRRVQLRAEYRTAGGRRRPALGHVPRRRSGADDRASSPGRTSSTPTARRASRRYRLACRLELARRRPQARQLLDQAGLHRRRLLRRLRPHAVRGRHGSTSRSGSPQEESRSMIGTTGLAQTFASTASSASIRTSRTHAAQTVYPRHRTRLRLRAGTAGVGRDRRRGRLRPASRPA
ncbi:MAG: hypothetical protein MZW92_52875 [Comamonadaceae bacterium]|nr:hypothetical protein [Comamonadaceae bacterium]